VQYCFAQEEGCLGLVFGNRPLGWVFLFAQDLHLHVIDYIGHGVGHDNGLGLLHANVSANVYGFGGDCLLVLKKTCMHVSH